MIIISCGIACMTGPSAPPVRAKPPNTITSRRTIPIAAYIISYLLAPASAELVEKRKVRQAHETGLARLENGHDFLQAGHRGGEVCAADLGALVGDELAGHLPALLDDLDPSHARADDGLRGADLLEPGVDPAHRLPGGVGMIGRRILQRRRQP